MSDDLDWDDIAPHSEDLASNSASSVNDIVPLPQENAIMPYVAPRDLVTKVPRATRWSFKLPHWSKQSPAEGALAAARMRDHKSLQAAPKRAAAQRRTVDTALQALRETGLLRDGARSVANIKGSILSITLPQGSSVQLPAIAMTELAFSDIQRRSDVGRAFKVDPRTACRVRI